MQLGIIGLPGSGRTTIFDILTGGIPSQRHKNPLIATVAVADERLDRLSGIVQPKKTVHATLEFLLPQGAALGKEGPNDESYWGETRPCDGLVHVVRNFSSPSAPPPAPEKEWLTLDQDMIVSDLAVVEKRIERIELDKKRGREISQEEFQLLQACLEVLNQEKALRESFPLAKAPLLKGFALLSAKPVLTVFNNNEDDRAIPPWALTRLAPHVVAVPGLLEREMAELSPEEATAFLEAYQVKDRASARLVRHSLSLLGLIAFFTIVHQEVRCWLIPEGTHALDAAGVIHSDMKKGFIRAEILPYEAFMDAGSYHQAKKDAKVRLEGKDYVVQDGDVIYFRFNV